MITIDDLPVFAGDIEPKPLDSGSESSVYRIPEQNLVAKVYRVRLWDDVTILVGAELWSPRTICYALREAVIADRLYQAGVSVPKPEGVFALRLPESKSTIPAFVMELITGVSHSHLEYSQYASARDQYYAEEAKAKQMGFYNLDTELDHNTLYVVGENDIRAYLHDFSGWRHPDLERWMRAEKDRLKSPKSTLGFLARVRNLWRGEQR